MRAFPLQSHCLAIRRPRERCYRLAHSTAPRPNLTIATNGGSRMADQAENRATRSNDVAQTLQSRQATETQSRALGNEVDVRTMVVGPETSFSGQITSCNRLIIEGAVDAKLYSR